MLNDCRVCERNNTACFRHQPPKPFRLVPIEKRPKPVRMIVAWVLFGLTFAMWVTANNPQPDGPPRSPIIADGLLLIGVGLLCWAIYETRHRRPTLSPDDAEPGNPSRPATSGARRRPPAAPSTPSAPPGEHEAPTRPRRQTPEPTTQSNRTCQFDCDPPCTREAVSQVRLCREHQVTVLRRAIGIPIDLDGPPPSTVLSQHRRRSARTKTASALEGNLGGRRATPRGERRATPRGSKTVSSRVTPPGRMRAASRVTPTDGRTLGATA